jgi:hypothetical protein
MSLAVRLDAMSDSTEATAMLPGAAVLASARITPEGVIGASRIGNEGTA